MKPAVDEMFPEGAGPYVDLDEVTMLAGEVARARSPPLLGMPRAELAVTGSRWGSGRTRSSLCVTC